MPFPLTVARCSTRSRSGTVAAGYVPSNVATGHSGAPILTKSITPPSIEVDEDPWRVFRGTGSSLPMVSRCSRSTADLDTIESLRAVGADSGHRILRRGRTAAAVAALSSLPWSHDRAISAEFRFARPNGV